MFTNRLKFLLIILFITIWFIGTKNYIEITKNKMEIDIAEKEILIYQSISNNTDLMNLIMKKL